MISDDTSPWPWPPWLSYSQVVSLFFIVWGNNRITVKGTLSEIINDVVDDLWHYHGWIQANGANTLGSKDLPSLFFRLVVNIYRSHYCTHHTQTSVVLTKHSAIHSADGYAANWCKLSGACIHMSNSREFNGYSLLAAHEVMIFDYGYVTSIWF